MSHRPEANVVVLILALVIQGGMPVAWSQGSVEPVRFVGNSQIPPILWVQNGKPVGLVAELAVAIAEKAQFPIRVEAMNWTDAQSLVGAGKADALLQINVTPERERLYDFSDTLLASHFHIFRKNSRPDLRTLRSLRGKRVGVEAGGFPAQFLNGQERIQQVVVPDWKSAFARLGSDELDAVILDRWVGEYVLSLNRIRGVSVVEPPLTTSYSRIAVRKGNAALLDRINVGLREIERDGSREQILQRWRGKDIVYVTQETIDGVLRWALIGAVALLIVITVISLGHVRAIGRVNGQLEERTRALLVENEERRRAEDALRQARDILERRVAERTAELSAANASLEEARQGALKLMQEAVAARDETKQTNSELAWFNSQMVGRELRMIELKREIDQLCAQLGLPARYGYPTDDAPGPARVSTA
jgi:ABC-type amino acid transport substrate-binding protein